MQVSDYEILTNELTNANPSRICIYKHESQTTQLLPPKVTTHTNRHKAHQRSWVSGTTTQNLFWL